jgi:sugar/nucleoside kinase (ribokinase family)
MTGTSINKVALYGNLIYDTYIELDSYRIGAANQVKSFKHSVGGVGNLLAILGDRVTSIHSTVGNDLAGRFIIQSLSGYNTKHLKKIPNSSFSIIIESYGEKTSLVHYQDDLPFEPSNADWHHFSYLDTSTGVSENLLRGLPGRVSADLAKSEYSEQEKERLFSLLPYIDVLFLSDLEALALSDSPLDETADKLNKFTRGITILHHTSGCVLSDKNRLESIRFKPLNIRNKLGAGDMLAALYIGQMLDNSNEKPFPAIQKSHEILGEILCKRDVI